MVRSPTSLTITQDTPDPSTVGSTVTVHWTLSASGSAPITGNVNLTVNGNAGNCSAAAAIGAGQCDLIFTAPGNRTITAAYAGDGNYGNSTDTESHLVTPPNQPPTADDDGPYDVLEDGSLNVTAANGVLVGDTDPEGTPLTAVKDTDPQHGTLTLNANGSFTYTPAADFNGDDSFTYHAFDGALRSSATRTVTIIVGARERRSQLYEGRRPRRLGPGPDPDDSQLGQPHQRGSRVKSGQTVHLRSRPTTTRSSCSPPADQQRSVR